MSERRPESPTTKNEFYEYHCVRFADQTLLEFFILLVLYELSVNPLRTDIIKSHSFTYSLFIHHDRPEKVSKEKGEREMLQRKVIAQRFGTGG